MKFSLSMIGFCVTFGLSILVLMYGWGLEVKSWPWVIFGGFGSAFFGAIIMAVPGD